MKRFAAKKALVKNCVVGFLVLILMMAVGFGCAVENDVTPEPDPDPVEDPKPVEEEEITKDEYLFQMTDVTYEIEETLGHLTKLEEVMDASEDWALMAEEEIENMESHIQKVRDKSAPEGMEEIHETFLKGVEEMEEGLDLYTYGVDQLEEESVKEGLQLMREGYQHVDRANVMLYEYDY